MPPKTAIAKSRKSKTGAFKPPRPAAAAASTSRRTSAPKRSEPASDDDEDEESPTFSAPTRRETAATPATLANPDPNAPPPSIPPDLLAHLIHHHLRDKDPRGLKMDRTAQVLVAKYMETFVREAMARARHEKNGSEGGAGRVFLEVRPSTMRCRKWGRCENAEELTRGF